MSFTTAILKSAVAWYRVSLEFFKEARFTRDGTLQCRPEVERDGGGCGRLSFL